MVNIALAYSRFKGYVPYTQQETRMNREIKNVVRNAREVNRRLHYHRLMTGSYKALFLMFGQYISREDQKMTLRTLQGESPEDLGNETGHSKSFVVHSCERAINEIHYYCSLLRGNPEGMGILVDLIGEIIEKEEEKKKKEVCNGVLIRKEPLTDGRKEQAFTYPTDVEYREDDLWMDTGCQEFAGDSSITEMEEE